MDTNGTSIIDFGLTRDQLVQLRRHWPATDARYAALIIHGINEHSGRYEHVGQFLADHHIDTIAIDNRGFGESGGRRGFVDSFDRYLDDVEDQIVQLKAFDLPIVLIGHSMGGLISLSYALSSRPLPDRLVLSGPALGAKIPSLLRLLTPVLARVAPGLRFPAPVKGDMLATDPAVGEAYFADPLVLRFGTPGLGAVLFRQMDWANANMSRLSLPTFVVHGADDPLVPARFSRPLADLPTVTRRAYPALRHEVFNEPNRDQILMDVVNWLGS